MQQKKQSEWYDQWEEFRDDETFLFGDWMSPNTLEDFRDKEVLECGCGGGQHTALVAPFARKLVAVDLNTAALARERNKSSTNVEFLEADIATMDLKRKFDVVFSIGVVHHTNNPDAAVENLKRHVKPGGKLILWVYSKEGNYLVRTFVEPLRKLLLTHVNRKVVLSISRLITFLMYMPIYSIYLLPARFLPYYDYFVNFRRMSFRRNLLNVFDKLNAPQVDFISKDRFAGWFDPCSFEEVHISSYRNVSWRGSGRLK
jgi:SAM-dependent methyltransferase